MKVGYIAKSNKKGQIVIPKGIRSMLGITKDTSLNMVVRENAVYMYPIKEVLGEDEKEDTSSVQKKPKADFWSLSGILHSSVSLNDQELKKARNAFEKQWSKHR